MARHHITKIPTLHYRPSPLSFAIATYVICSPAVAAEQFTLESPSRTEPQQTSERQEANEQFIKTGDYKNASALTAQKCQSLEDELGEESGAFLSCMDELGELQGKQAEYAAADDTFSRSLKIKERILDPDDPSIAITLNNLAVLRKKQGDFATAAELNKRALSIRQRSLGPEHLETSQSLNNLAELRRAQGRYHEAEALHKQALRIRRDAPGSNQGVIAQSINNLAAVYNNQGKHREAAKLLEDALSIRKQALAPGHPDIANTMDNLGTTYAYLGEYDKAEVLAKEALELNRRVLGLGHPLVATGMCNLAFVHTQQGATERAEELLQGALSIFNSALGPNHPTSAFVLFRLAGLRYRRSDYDAAELLYRQALEIYESRLDPGHVWISMLLTQMGMMYYHRGLYAESESYLERALSSLRAADLRHPGAAVGIGGLARLSVVSGDYDSALDLYRRALDIEDREIARFLTSTNERQKLAHAATLRRSTNEILSLHLQGNPGDRAVAALALTTLLRRKGRTQELATQSYSIIRRALPSEKRHILDDLSLARAHYAALVHRGPGKLSAGEFARRISSVQNTQDELWRSIAGHVPSLDVSTSPITIDGVRRALPESSALLEFAQYVPRHDARGRYVRRSSPARYALYLISSDQTHWFDLGPVDAVDSKALDFRTSLATRQSDVIVVSQRLYEAVLKPAIDRLRRVDRVFIAPEGALSLVPFGALYDGNDYLVESYELNYLSTGRDLLRPWARARGGDSVLAVADPTNAKLPGAKREAELLAELFPGTRLLTGSDATELQVRTQPRPWILHMATHGFFEPGRLGHDRGAHPDDLIDSVALGPGLMSPSLADNPMLYSGLLLATPSTESRMTGDAGVVDDGRLTAYEISDWDLRGTELVVLSACDSGLGDVQAGEGVFGLRRAFMIAGAQTQVMSLWKIEDGSAARMMEAYYSGLLAGKGRSQAMQEVQSAMLREGRHPGDWGSFVVLGEWDPLSRERLPTPTIPPLVKTKPGCRASIIRPDGSTFLFLLALFRLLTRRRRRHRGLQRREGEPARRSAAPVARSKQSVEPWKKSGTPGGVPTLPPARPRSPPEVTAPVSPQPSTNNDDPRPQFRKDPHDRPAEHDLAGRLRSPRGLRRRPRRGQRR